ncbi:MAG: RpiB/LacA/LacB family sugar-phosphate isomerase [Patescibacteria group bacterium]
MPKPTIYLGADHAGWKMKEAVESALRADGFDVTDLGNQVLEATDDYPEFAFKVANEVANHPGSFGVLSCGSAEGVCIVANKVKGIRAAVIYSQFAAESSRTDDDANIAFIPGRGVSTEDGVRMIQQFLATKFSGAERHQRRIAKIAEIENQTL